MSAEIAIHAEGLGKRYTLGEMQGGYRLLTEVVSERFSSAGRRRRRSERAAADEFWALRDVGFEVKRGETFGIIGHNGAGKSTLLKILSRITVPTLGEAVLRGRVGALLEVGTGFHPELTGRENVFLNGAILGMPRIDIARRFDEIVDFAGVERFIDTPVKRYSSGMQLRLAFAVAAHLEPEILVIDEVLSVGDLAFQEKCVVRMEAVAGEGRTVLFVSHNLRAVSKLCERSLLLSGGEVVAQGATAGVIDEYVKGVQIQTATRLAERKDRQGNGALRFLDVHYESEGRVIDSPISGRTFDIVLSFETPGGRPQQNVVFGITISTPTGELMLMLSSQATGTVLPEIPLEGQVRCTIPRCPLPAGQYVLNVFAARGSEPLDWLQRASEMTVIDGDFFGTGRGIHEAHRSVLVDHDWTVTGDVGISAAAIADDRREVAAEAAGPLGDAPGVGER